MALKRVHFALPDGDLLHRCDDGVGLARSPAGLTSCREARTKQIDTSRKDDALRGAVDDEPERDT